MSKQKKHRLTKDLPEQTALQYEVVQRRFERLKRLIELSAPRFFVEEECRMIAYGALGIASALDDDGYGIPAHSPAQNAKGSVKP